MVKHVSVSILLILLLTSFVSVPAIASSSDAITTVHATGNSPTANEQKDKKEKKDKDEKEKKDKPDKAKGKSIEQTGDYLIEVTCEFDADLDQTECVFTGFVPDGGKKIGHFDIPADSVCAEVIDGDYAFVDPDPHTDVFGYSSRGNEAAITLIMRGEVTVSGTATYWLKVANAVFPTSGAGISCATASDEDQLPASPTATSQPAGGSLVVTSYTCVDVPADRDGFDWFGGCHLLDGAAEFELVAIASGISWSGTPAESATGELTFSPLDAGTYQLTQPDQPWCHAESDNVNSAGEVIIAEGERTNVWMFNCP